MVRHILTVTLFLAIALASRLAIAADPNRFSSTYGISTHLDLGHLPLWTEIHTVSRTLFDKRTCTKDGNIDTINRVRLTLGYRLHNQLSVFAGPMLNILLKDAEHDTALSAMFYETTKGDTTVQIAMGFVGGVQWHL